MILVYAKDQYLHYRYVVFVHSSIERYFMRTISIGNPNWHSSQEETDNKDICCTIIPPKKVGKTSRFSRTILTLKSSQYNTVNAFAVQKLWKLLTKEFFATSIIKIKEQADSSAMVISKGYFCSVLCTLRNWMMHFLLTL